MSICHLFCCSINWTTTRVHKNQCEYGISPLYLILWFIIDYNLFSPSNLAIICILCIIYDYVQYQQSQYWFYVMSSEAGCIYFGYALFRLGSLEMGFPQLPRIPMNWSILYSWVRHMSSLKWLVKILSITLYSLLTLDSVNPLVLTSLKNLNLSIFTLYNLDIFQEFFDILGVILRCFLDNFV